MTTALMSHPDSVGHDMGPGHPERPERIKALLHRFEDSAFAPLVRLEAPPADRDAILRVHPATYVDGLFAARPAGHDRRQLDADTAMNAGTWAAIDRAAGGACLAIDQVLGGAVHNAFVAMRPPGHHAETSKAMGFCFFNTAAIAARHAQSAHGVGRVAIMDFDVHHGNGTQDIFWSDASVLYCSTHEMPLYPGTGASNERGEHDNIVNAPLRAGDGGEAFRAAMEGLILPRLDAFAPDVLVISAGFDAHWRDPLANLKFEAGDFDWATRALLGVARRHAKGRVVSILEGGYDLEGLSSSAAAHVEALMKDPN